MGDDPGFIFFTKTKRKTIGHLTSGSPRFIVFRKRHSTMYKSNMSPFFNH